MASHFLYRGKFFQAPGEFGVLIVEGVALGGRHARFTHRSKGKQPTSPIAVISITRVCANTAGSEFRDNVRK
jgi:hypothetical protein